MGVQADISSWGDRVVLPGTVLTSRPTETDSRVNISRATRVLYHARRRAHIMKLDPDQEPDLYRIIVETMTEGLVLATRDATMEYVNHRMAEMLGYTPDEMIGRDAKEFLRQDSREVLVENLRARAAGRTTEYDLCWVARDGHTVYTKVSGTPLFEDGEQVGSVAVVTDITHYREVEMALRASRERYSRLIEASPFVVFLTDVEGTIVMVNRQGVVQYGGEESDELVGKDILKLVSPESRPAVQEMMQLALREGVVRNRRLTLIRRDGTEFPAQMSIAVVCDQDGVPTGFSGVVVDMSNMVRAQEALKRSEQKYRNLIEESLQGLAIIQDGRVVFANRALAEITGYDVEELMTLDTGTIWSLVHPDDLPRVERAQKKTLDNQTVMGRVEHRIVRKDGEIRWVDAFASTLEYEGRRALQVAMIDITERKRAEEAIIRSEMRYRALAEKSLQGLAIIDEHGFAYVNRALAHIVGRSRDELVEMSMDEVWALFHEEDRAAIRSGVLGALAGKRVTMRGEYRVIHSAGTVRWVDTFATATDYGGQQAVQMVFIDTTERRRAEMRAHRIRDQAMLYLDLLGHDIRNQLQVIQISASLLRGATDESLQESLFKVVEESVQRCARLIEEAKDIEHLTAAQLKERPLLDAVRSCVAALESRTTGVEFVTEFDVQTATVVADEYLELLVTNILVNAVEHNPRDDKKVWVRVWYEDKGYVLSVADNGPGIPDARKADLFLMSRRYGGLGLHQSRQIVDKYGGRIEARDRVPGDYSQGAEFRLWLPAAGTTAGW